MRFILIAFLFVVGVLPACAQSTSALNVPSVPCAYASFSPGPPPTIACATPPSNGATGPQGPAGPAGATGATGPAGPAGSGTPWRSAALPTSPSPYTISAADAFVDRTWDGGAGSAAVSILLPAPSSLAGTANFATNVTVYSGTVTLGKVSGATFTFKGLANNSQAPTLVAGDSAYIRPDDKGNWAVSVSNSIDAPHP